MKTKIIILMCLFASVLNADDLMMERFGMSRVEPVYSGYVFLNGHYLDAPYIIEQRGVGLFINAHRFGTVSLHFPGPYDTPLYEDPGMPDDIDENTPLAKAYMHPITRKKHQYWTTMELTGEEYLRRRAEYFSSLPPIKEVITHDDYRQSVIHLDGTGITTVPRDPKRKASFPRFPSDEGRMMSAINAAKSAACPYTRLSDRIMMIVLENGSATWQYAPQAGLKAVISILDSEKSREEKIKDLIDIGFITDKTLSYSSYNEWLDGLLDDFQATDQLHERLAGTWVKPECPDIITGLVQLPAFAKVEVSQPEPPEGDFNEDMLGWMRSEPIVSGYVFIDGAYVDPPYVVEQRGNVLLINNRICENAPEKPLIFATFAPASADGLPAGYWPESPGNDADPFNEPLEKAENRRIMLRMQALYCQVIKYLEEDGVVITEDKRLCALHKHQWYDNWCSWQGRMIAYKQAPKYTVSILPGLFIPITDNTQNPDEEEVETAIKRYGKFLTEYKVTPAFFIRWAGGDAWTDFLESHIPDQPSGVIQPPGIEETK